MSMFANALRSQARLGLLSAARSAVVPASRSLSSLVVRQALLSSTPSVSRLVVSRAFSSAPVLSYEQGSSATSSEPSSSIFIGNMPWSMTQEDLSDMFGEFGAVENVRIQTHADGRPRGFAHITFASKESAVAAVTSAREEPLHVSGRDLVIDYARQAAATYTKVEPSNKIYFARFTEDEAQLRTFLNEWKDSIVSVYFMRDGNTGEKIPSGFVEFRDVETATEVIDKLNNTQLTDGETLRLSYARARKASPGGGGSRYPPRQERGPKRAHYTSRDYRSDRPQRSEGNSYGGGRGGGEGGDRWN